MANRTLPSGVYGSQTDALPGVVGTTTIIPAMFLMTPKGQKVNVVTPSTWKDMLGYDLGYNSGFASLEYLMRSLAEVKVIRMNVDTLLGNAALVGGKVRHSIVADKAELSSEIFPVEVSAVSAVTEQTITLPTEPTAGTVEIYNGASVVATVNLEGTVVSTGGYSGTLAAAVLKLTCPVADEALLIKYLDDSVPELVVGTVDGTAAFNGMVVTLAPSTAPTKPGTTVTITKGSDVVFTQTYVTLPEQAGPVYIFPSAALDLTKTHVVSLANGANGNAPTSADVSFLANEQTPTLFLLAPFAPKNIVDSLATTAKAKSRIFLTSSPLMTTFTAFSVWLQTQSFNEYCSVLPTVTVNVLEGREYPVDAGCVTFMSFAAQYAAKGTYYEPPAGSRWGRVSGIDIIKDNDFADSKAKLFPLRANFIKTQPYTMLFDNYTANPAVSLDSARAYTYAQVLACHTQHALEQMTLVWLFIVFSITDLSVFQGQIDSFLLNLQDNNFLLNYRVDYENMSVEKGIRNSKIIVYLRIAEDLEVLQIVIDVDKLAQEAA